MRLVHLVHVGALSLLAIVYVLVLDRVPEEVLVPKHVTGGLWFLVFMLALHRSIELYRKVPMRQSDQDPQHWWRIHGRALVPVWTMLTGGGVMSILVAFIGDMSPMLRQLTVGFGAGSMVLALMWFRPSRLESTDREHRSPI